MKLLETHKYTALVYSPGMWPQHITYTNKKSWGCIAGSGNISCHVDVRWLCHRLKYLKMTGLKYHYCQKGKAFSKCWNSWE